MRARKICLLVTVFLLGAVLGKPLALGSLGLFVKTFLYLDKGWSFHYDTIDWREGTLLFSSVKLKEKQSFSLKSPQMGLHFSRKHLELNSPHLVISSVPLSSQNSDWTLSLKNGTLEGAGLQKARFSFEKMLPDQVGHLLLEWDRSKLNLDAIRQGAELVLEVELQQFEASLLEHQPPCQGVVQGCLHLVFESNQWKRGSAHLNVEKLGYGDFFSDVDGTLDWDGDAIDFSSFSLHHQNLSHSEDYQNPQNLTGHSIADGKKISDLNEERLHLVVANGLFNSPLGEIQEVKGNVSFLSGLGAKWELSGKDASQEPLVCHGRAFFHAQKARWIETDLQWHSAELSLKGNEERGGLLWNVTWDRIGSIQAEKLYPYLVSLEPNLIGWEFCQGSLSGSAQVFMLSSTVFDWEAWVAAENLLCCGPKMQFGCEIAKGNFASQNKKGQFSFDGVNFSSSLYQHIEGKKWKGWGQIDNGLVIDSLIQGECEGLEASIKATGSIDRFFLEAQTNRGSLVVTGIPQEELLELIIEKGDLDHFCFSGKGCLYRNVSSSIDGFCQIRGKWQYAADQSLPFYCPIIEKKGTNIVFDAHLEGATWDWVRLYGELKESGEIIFDPARSHFLGESVDISLCQWDLNGLHTLSMQVELHRSSSLLAASFFTKDLGFLTALPLTGSTCLSFHYEREGDSCVTGKGKNLFWNGYPIGFDFLAQGKQGHWEIVHCRSQDFSLTGKIRKEKDIFRVYDGRTDWKQKFNAQFEGNIYTTPIQSEFHLPHLSLELGALDSFASSLSLPFKEIKGVLEGSGCITWKEALQADFDCTASQLKIGAFEWENRGPLHFYYSPTEGISLSGLDCHSAKYQGAQAPDFNCKMDLLGYDPKASSWFLHGAHVYAPLSLMEKMPKCPPLFQGISLDQNIDFFTDCCIASDFSKCNCYMREAFIPIGETLRHLQNLTLVFSKDELWAQCDYSHQGHPLKLRLDVDLEPAISGKLILESLEYPLEEGQLPLTTYWTHHETTGFSIKEIQGTFPGVEASFHQVGDHPYLIGSARFDCSIFSQMVPPYVAELFSDLKMGKGYELKGRLFTSQGWPSFSGLLSGKQFDLFGYQLRTLLGQIELSSEKVHVFDLKISDSAAILKTEEILAESKEGALWTIDIPRITILELRPSLLKKTGGEEGVISPLVIRELHIDDFKGLLDDSKTYTARGELSFINSYRREHTLFDIPADLLSRIVGLDLALLIPACGHLSYELKEGKFYLKELTGAYSEGKRSEFFLVPTDPVPTMDLNGKLQILVKCNQFVLFKFMESFMISIEGELNDPKFHLQKKRRFWGL